MNDTPTLSVPVQANSSYHPTPTTTTPPPPTSSSSSSSSSSAAAVATAATSSNPSTLPLTFTSSQHRIQTSDSGANQPLLAVNNYNCFQNEEFYSSNTIPVSDTRNREKNYSTYVNSNNSYDDSKDAQNIAQRSSESIYNGRSDHHHERSNSFSFLQQRLSEKFLQMKPPSSLLTSTIIPSHASSFSRYSLPYINSTKTTSIHIPPSASSTNDPHPITSKHTSSISPFQMNSALYNNNVPSSEYSENQTNYRNSHFSSATPSVSRSTDRRNPSTTTNRVSSSSPSNSSMSSDSTRTSHQHRQYFHPYARPNPTTTTTNTNTNTTNTSTTTIDHSYDYLNSHRHDNILYVHPYYQHKVCQHQHPQQYYPQYELGSIYQFNTQEHQQHQKDEQYQNQQYQNQYQYQYQQYQNQYQNQQYQNQQYQNQQYQNQQYQNQYQNQQYRNQYQNQNQQEETYHSHRYFDKNMEPNDPNITSPQETETSSGASTLASPVSSFATNMSNSQISSIPSNEEITTQRNEINDSRTIARQSIAGSDLEPQLGYSRSSSHLLYHEKNFPHHAYARVLNPKNYSDEELKQMISKLKNEMKVISSFENAIKEFMKIIPISLNRNLSNYVYKTLAQIVQQVHRYHFPSDFAKYAFDLAHKHKHRFVPAYQKDIETWKNFIDNYEMSDKGVNRYTAQQIRTCTPLNHASQTSQTHIPNTRRMHYDVIKNQQAKLVDQLLMNDMSPSSLYPRSQSHNCFNTEICTIGAKMCKQKNDIMYAFDLSQLPEYMNCDSYPYLQNVDALLSNVRIPHRAESLDIGRNSEECYCGTRIHDFHFEISKKQWEDIEKNNLQVRICTYLDPSKQRSSTLTTAFVKFTINTHSLKSSIEDRRFESIFGSQVTAHCMMGRNNLKIASHTCCCALIFEVRIVKPLTTKDLVQYKIKNDMLDYEKSLHLIKRAFSAEEDDDDDDDIAVTSCKYSLKDVVSMSKINVPVRGKECDHVQVFDLGTFLEINQQNPKFKCPICKKVLLFSSLRVDPFFQKVLDDSTQDKNCEFTEVIVNSDTSYQFSK